MVRRNIVGSRSEAQGAIEAHRVTVGGAIAEKAARMVAPHEAVVLLGLPRRYVSRGGDKLEYALSYFDLDPSGLHCLDVGASTGGFCDCLLQHRAARVYAVDVGHGQLAQRLRADERVVVWERLHARDLSLEHCGGRPIEMVTIDVSFISLRLVVPYVVSLLGDAGRIVALVKPQFEATRRQVGKGGIVREPPVWRSVLGDLSEALSARGVYMVGVVPSPIKGAKGNVEFLALLEKDNPKALVQPEALDAAVEQALSGR